mmetsp:Transcript_242/g.770  ORF Transcript_242/g.770 Transcript_242/m.770 type:complete len:401 (+) Transcript_242:117-1319(+)
MPSARKRTAPRSASRTATKADTLFTTPVRSSAGKRDAEGEVDIGLTPLIPKSTLPPSGHRPRALVRREEPQQEIPRDSSAVVFTGKCLSRVRWLQEGARSVVGSAEGSPGQDFLRIYDYSDGNISPGLQCVHPGKVFDLEIVSDQVERALCASSDGTVRIFNTSDGRLDKVGAFPEGEAASAVSSLSSTTAIGTGSEGTIAVMEVDTGKASSERYGSDGIGIRAAVRLSSSGFATAGMSGYVSVWDAREGLQTPVQRLRYPMSRASMLCMDVDAAQTHFLFAGTDRGEVVCWDRRKEHFPASRTAAHASQIWDIRLMKARPGVLLSCGEDASVLAWDFTAAAHRGVGTDEYWTAEVTEEDLKQLAVGKTLAVNSVDVHPRGDLVSYVTDSSTVAFTSFYR